MSRHDTDEFLRQHVAALTELVEALDLAMTADDLRDEVNGALMDAGPEGI